MSQRSRRPASRLIFPPTIEEEDCVIVVEEIKIPSGPKGIKVKSRMLVPTPAARKRFIRETYTYMDNNFYDRY